MSHPMPTDAEQAVSPRSVRIVRARAMSYRVPQQRARRGPVNYIVELTGEVSDSSEASDGHHRVAGIGEGQPRGFRTGDSAGESWKFLRTVVEDLHTIELPVSEPTEALEHIRALMGRFSQAAQSHGRDDDDATGDETHLVPPYSGTLLGVEVALLDLVARVRGTTVAQLLGKTRELAPIAPAPVFGFMSDSTMRDVLAEQAEHYENVHLVAAGDVDQAVDFAERVAAINGEIAITDGESVAEKALWINTNGSFSPEQAEQFIRKIMVSVNAGRLPRRITLQYLMPVKHRDLLPKLQRRITWTARLSRRRDIDVRIMTTAMAEDGLAQNQGRRWRGIRALEVRPAQVGGILASIDLVHQAVARDPDTLICLRRMVGASRLTSAALRHLALALPRIDSAELASVVERTLEITSRVVPEGESEDESFGADPVELAEDESATNHGDEGRSLEDDDPVDEYEESTESGPDRERWQQDHAQDSSAYRDSLGSEYERPSDFVEDPEDRAEDDESIRSLSVQESPGIGVHLIPENLVTPAINYVTFPEPSPVMFEGQPARTYDDVDYIAPLGSYAVHGHIVEREALAFGLNTRRFNKSTFFADDGVHKPLTFRTARWPLTSVVASSIVRHKEATRILLDQFDCPVPQGRTFNGRDVDGAFEFATRIGYPVVLKPAAGSMGVGVTANIADAEEFGAALDRFHQSTMGTGEFIVEKHIHGRDYRIMVLGDEVLAAVERVPASVLGDGRSTVIDLIMDKNALRRQNSHLGTLRMKWNAATKYEVAKAGFAPDSIIPDGQRVYLNSVNNLTQGGDSIEILDDLHPSIIEASIKAVQAVPGLAYCGVDFLLEDHRKPLTEQEGAICELNAVAAIPVAEYPMFGTPRPLAKKFLLKCVEEFGLDAHAERAESLKLKLQVRGKVTGVGYRRWFARRAQEYGCVGTIRNRTGRRLEIRVGGPTAAVSALVTAAILGPPRARPTSVTSTHIEESLGESFVILGGASTDGSAP